MTQEYEAKETLTTSVGEDETPIQKEHDRQDNGTRNLKNEQTTARNNEEMKFGTWGTWEKDLQEQKNEEQGQDRVTHTTWN